MFKNPGAFAILVGGGIGGAFDITYAIVFSSFRGVSAERVLQSVAGGLLGEASYDGGPGTAALGLGLHFLIALIWASIFWFASRRLPFLTQRPVLAGLLYGIVIYAGMNLVVLPLSATPPRTSFPPLAAILRGLTVHMFLIGVPIALAARKASTFAVRKVAALAAA